MARGKYARKLVNAGRSAGRSVVGGAAKRAATLPVQRFAGRPVRGPAQRFARTKPVGMGVELYRGVPGETPLSQWRTGGRQGRPMGPGVDMLGRESRRTSSTAPIAMPPPPRKRSLLARSGKYAAAGIVAAGVGGYATRRKSGLDPAQGRPTGPFAY